MTENSNASIIEFLSETLSVAGRELQRFQEKDLAQLKVSFKADASLVTEADLASEKIIIDRIMRYFPEDQIYSEESGLSSTKRPAGAYIWVIDPLDGTTNFANGYPFYCISIGRGRFLEDGRIEIIQAGILDPCRAKCYLGAKGLGATLNGQPLRVAAARDLSKCFLVTGFYYMKGDDLQAEIERFARVAQSCQSIRRDGAAALDLAMVAEGVYDAFWEVGLQPWDLAAGTLLVAEAGGCVRNYTQSGQNMFNVEGVGVVAGSHGAVTSISAML